jgi:hypothetical protein
VSTKI